MLKVLKYSFYDLMRSRWSYVYFAFYLVLGFVLLFLNNDLSKVEVVVFVTDNSGKVLNVQKAKANETVDYQMMN